MKMTGRGAAKEEEKNQKPAGGGGCSFVLPSGERCRLGKDRFRFRVRVSCFSQCVILPPFSFCVLWRPVFIGKNIVWASKLIPQLFFFVNLIFLVFFWIFLSTSPRMRKISDFKNNALKVKRVPKIFENLNSFETMLKMLKTMQIY